MSYSPGGFQLGSTSEYWVAVCPSGTLAADGAPPAALVGAENAVGAG